MINEFPGLNGLVEVLKQVSTGPYRVEAGTITDAKHEIVAEFCSPPDARAIEAMLHLREDLTALLLALQDQAGHSFCASLALAVTALKEKLVRWNNVQPNPEDNN